MKLIDDDNIPAKLRILSSAILGEIVEDDSPYALKLFNKEYVLFAVRAL